MAYRIDRIIPGGFHDYLLHLWEGDDLPSFMGSTQRAYLFDDKATADSVAQRLAAKCSETMATPHLPAKPITYEVVEVSQHAWGRYMVFSNDKYKADFPNVVPAGRYDKLDDAIKHAESVTYKMVVVDSKAESRGFIYCNWATTEPLTPDNCGCSQIACNIINNTFLSLDGFEAMRKQMAGTDYTAEHFGAELARIADREIAGMLNALRAMIEPMAGVDADEFVPETSKRIKDARALATGKEQPKQLMLDASDENELFYAFKARGSSETARKVAKFLRELDSQKGRSTPAAYWYA